MSDAELKSKLERHFIAFSPFPANTVIATTYLKGLLQEKEVNVDDNRGHLALRELSMQVYQKSEIVCSDNELLRKSKEFTSEDLQTIFETKEKSCLRDRMRDEYSQKGGLTFLEKESLLAECIKITSTHQYLRKKIQEDLGEFEIKGDFVELVNSLCGRVAVHGDMHVLRAVVIDIIAEKFVKG